MKQTKLSKQIKAFRIARKLSQKAMGVLCHIAQTDLSRIETGKWKPGAIITARINRVMDVRTDETGKVKPALTVTGPPSVGTKIAYPKPNLPTVKPVAHRNGHVKKELLATLQLLVDAYNSNSEPLKQLVIKEATTVIKKYTK